MAGLQTLSIGSIPATSIDKIRHPDFTARELDFYKWRSVFEGGRQFINRYLIKFSARETDEDFANRKCITYPPAHAKAAITDIRNAIFQRMTDITRIGGPKSYQDAVAGIGRGVDNRGNSMNSYIGRFVLQELLVLGRVGIYIDKPPLPKNSTLADTDATRPYLYIYTAESIRSWHYNEANELDAILLEDHFYSFDEDSGLVTGQDTRYRLMRLTSEGVVVTFYEWEDDDQGKRKLVETVKLLDLKRIPFVILELTNSLLADVADYQIALLNLGSSDMNYAMKSNFPFYTEQYSPQSRLPHMRPAGADDGTANEAGTSKAQEINSGGTQGRAYSKDLERPGFIHPSPEPLRVSMEKQDRMIIEIRQLVNLALTSIRPARASAESKALDNQGLEAGLSYIGLELEYCEREIAKIWAEYEEDSPEPAYVKYPDNYELRTDKDRRAEAAELEDLKKGTPSETYKKVIAKQIARVTVGTQVTQATLNRIYAEIDAAIVVDTDPDIIRMDHEAGFVSTATGSQIRGYPKGEAAKAAVDHAERISRIAAAQSPDGMQRMAARGVPDGEGDRKSGAEEKEMSQSADGNDVPAKKTRGESDA